jgi:predicted TIM-barrel fold metal-dependent hydrolase
VSAVCPPAREVTSKPKLIAPKGTCDCHFHIIGDPAQYPFSPNRSYTPTKADEAAYLRMADTLGIERVVIVQPSVYSFDNRATIDAVKNFGKDRARAVVLLGSDVGNAELKRMDEAGVRAVRFITFAAGGAPLDQLKTVANRIAPLGWHMQMYVRPGHLLELAPVLKDLPIQFVFDHLGAIMADKNENDPALKVILGLLDANKAWVKVTAYRSSVAGYPYRDANWITQTYVKHAPERCIWGSDWPHPQMHQHMPDDGELIDLLLESVPDTATRNRILADNPAKLYGFA